MATRVFNYILILAFGSIVAFDIIRDRPFGRTLDEFKSDSVLIHEARITRHSEGRARYFELNVIGDSGLRYYFREPDEGNFDKYRSALPVGRVVTIRYRTDEEGRQIIGARDDQNDYIDFDDSRADADQKRSISYAIAGASLIIGFGGLCWERRKAKLQSI